jgi:REP element-mobilizing transposase RayT
MPFSRPGHAPRLAEWDYASAGAYAVTIVVAGRRPILSTLHANRTIHTAIGDIVWDGWHRLPERFPNVRLDAAVLMPDHLHAIIWLQRPRRMIDVPDVARAGPTRLRPMMADPRVSLGKVVRAWKGAVTRRIHREIDPTFAWQPRYYDHVIRGHAQLARARGYVRDNPRRAMASPPHAATVARAQASTSAA